MILTGLVIGTMLGLFSGCDQTALREATVGAEGVRTIFVIGKAGSLRVVGRPGLREVRVKGTACASSASLLSEVQLDARREGNEIRVEAQIPDTRGWNNQAALDFIVEIPEGLTVSVRDSSGEVEIDGVADLKVVDGSGLLEIRNVRGSLDVQDGSGSISISNVSGKVSLRDNSGGLSIEGAEEVVIEEDGSGGISIRDIKGNVLIRDDGSGSIDVSNVGGNFEVSSDGSGGVSHDRVRGTVKIPRD